MRGARAGYTLLEVLIAMAILAVGLSVLLGTQSTSALMTERANRMAQSALLARSKMADIEQQLLSDGFSDMEERIQGDFHDEGFRDIRWEAVVEVVEIPPEAAPEFAASINSQLFGDGEQGGALSGSAAVSQWMPMILAEVPNIINQMAERARFVTLTIEWDEGRHTQTLTVQQYIVNLNRGGAEGQIETLTQPGMGQVTAPGSNEALRIR